MVHSPWSRMGRGEVIHDQGGEVVHAHGFRGALSMVLEISWSMVLGQVVHGLEWVRWFMVHGVKSKVGPVPTRPGERIGWVPYQRGRGKGGERGRVGTFSLPHDRITHTSENIPLP